MRILILFLLVVASPIFIGVALSGNGLSLGDIRQEVAASDFAHDAMGRAHDYAATLPGLVEGVKAHRAEFQELRSRLCSMVQC